MAVIDFMSDPPSELDEAFEATQQAALGNNKVMACNKAADDKGLGALRHARLRQQTVSLILQDDPGKMLLEFTYMMLTIFHFMCLFNTTCMNYCSIIDNTSLRGLLDQLNSDVGTLQGRLVGDTPGDADDDFDLPLHDAWMNTVQQGDDRAV